MNSSCFKIMNKECCKRTFEKLKNCYIPLHFRHECCRAGAAIAPTRQHPALPPPPTASGRLNELRADATDARPIRGQSEPRPETYLLPLQFAIIYYRERDVMLKIISLCARTQISGI